MKVVVNGVLRKVDGGDESKPLLEWLREKLDLTGTKNGCGIGRCGSCTVLVDAKAVLACRKTVQDVVGLEVTTVEGLSDAGKMDPLQESFLAHGAVQCGFCTPGMLMRAKGLLIRNATPTRDEIRRSLSPNLCRCTGYQQIVDAVEYVAHDLELTRGKDSQ